MPDTPSISAVIITRNRPNLLRQTIHSLRNSTYRLSQIVVSDDSTDGVTAVMLAREFPDVMWIQGPRRGRAANRNHGIRAAAGADFTLVSDDDVFVDYDFCRKAIDTAKGIPESLIFPALREEGFTFVPNDVSFLGHHTKPYMPDAAYRTAHSACFMLARSITERVQYDEIITAYGYEEVDFVYRVAAVGFRVICIPECVCTHLAPSTSVRPQKEVNRLYVTFKRHWYVDRNLLKGLAFLGVAVPHHILASYKQAGWRGVRQAFSNVRLAMKMFQKGRRAHVLA